MTEFLFWLYPAYIKSYLSTISKDDADALRFSLLNGSLCPAQKKDMEVVIRFYAAHSFQLELRTRSAALPGARVPRRPSMRYW